MRKFLKDNFNVECLVFIIFGVAIVLGSIFIPEAHTLSGCVIGGLFSLAGIIGLCRRYLGPRH